MVVMLSKRLLFIMCITVFLTISGTFMYRNQYIRNVFLPPPSHQWNLNVTVAKIKVTDDTPYCCKMEEDVYLGKWVTRTNVLPKEVMEVEKSNLEIRRLKAIPNVVLRSDSKCGPKFPMGGYQSQCNAMSNMPCCHEDSGTCGNTTKYCDCIPGCVNYKNIVRADFADWVDEFQMKEYSSKSSCDFLASHFTSVLLMGDSLARHFFSGFLTHLTNDDYQGAIISSKDSAVKALCIKDHQFFETQCRAHLAVLWKDIKANKKYCEHSEKKIKISFTEAYHTSYVNWALDATKEAILGERPVIVFGIAHHNGLDENTIIKYYLNPIIKVARSTIISKPLLVWLTAHSVGPHKPVGFLPVQSNANILRFNKVMADYCKTNRLLVFDTFNLTREVYSFDGTHYAGALNRAKVKLLMKFLKFHMDKMNTKIEDY